MTTRRIASASNPTASPFRRLARIAAAVAPIAVLFASSVARADDKCPPGSWFCVDAEIRIGPTDTPPPPPAVPVPPVVLVPAPPPVAPAPPVVIYTPAPPPVYAPAPPPSYISPPPPRERWHSETSVSVRLEAATLGSNDNARGRSAGMGGLGLALRYRPAPHFGVELGVDFVGGADSNGDTRRETALSAVGMLYLNPRSAAQFYLLGGVGIAGAHVDVGTGNGTFSGQSPNYSYMGVLFGAGLEVRASRRVAFNFDVRGFVRGRTDDGSSRAPEFTAADGRTTNTSGGALLTDGTTIFF